MGTTRPKYKEFRAKMDMEDHIIVIRMIFSVGQHFRKVVREYGIKNEQNFFFKKNDNDKVKVLCSVLGCICIKSLA